MSKKGLAILEAVGMKPKGMPDDDDAEGGAGVEEGEAEDVSEGAEAAAEEAFDALEARDAKAFVLAVRRIGM